MIRHFRQSIVLVSIWLPTQTHEEWILGVIRCHLHLPNTPHQERLPHDAKATGPNEQGVKPWAKDKWISSGSLSCNKVLARIRSDLSQLGQQWGFFNPEIEIPRRQERQLFRDIPEGHTMASFLFSFSQLSCINPAHRKPQKQSL